jgi:hypothetical protein
MPSLLCIHSHNLYISLRTINSIIILGDIGCSCRILGSFPNCYHQEILSCQLCRCAVHVTAGYIMLSTKCDNPKGKP